MKKTLHFCLIAFFSFFCLIPNVISQKNWELLNPKPSYNTGKEIRFISENVGYILNSDEILETSDSGITWKKKQNIYSGNDLKFYNNVGYIVGGNGYVLKSIDSGSSWVQISTGYFGSFNTVNIINETTIIISSSNSLVKSTDGGNTWNSLEIPSTTVNKTVFTTALIGHAACDNGRMFKTIDGGVSWYTTMTSNVIPSDFFNIYFINQNVGFATQEHDNLYKTVDGGETWTLIPDISSAIYNFSFINENDGYAVGDSGVIFKTTNGGLNWSSAGFQVGLIDNSSLYGVHFLDSNKGFATGARGRIIRTKDGGKTWTENSPTYNDINNIQFLTKERGIAQVGNSFFKTTDSGSSWNKISSINYNQYSSIVTFKFLNENVGYAAAGGTNGGYIFKTIDGGVTWNALNAGFRLIDEGISSISFFNENTGVISGGYNQEKILKTTDGGNSWVQLSNYDLPKIQFLDENLGYAHNYYNKNLYKTIDGGINWQIVFTAKEDIKSIDFLDKDHGYLVGSNGLIFKTNNGGIDWIKLEIPYEYYTYVKFYSKNVGYIFDEEGKLYKTKNGGSSWENIFNLPSTYGNNIISINGEDIYIAGENGKLLKSVIDFEPFVLELKPAENILGRSAVLSGNVSVNTDYFDNVHLEYFNSAVIHKVDISTNAINAGTSLDFSLPLSDLDPDSLYYCRIVANRNNVPYYSETMIFNTNKDYLLTIKSINNIYATKVGITGTITSYKYNITDVEFQYSTEQSFSKYEILKSNILVQGNTTENISETLSVLKPNTLYFVRLKAKYEGKDVYSEIDTFETPLAYRMNLSSPNILDNNVKFTAFVQSNSNDITNIVFEYGIFNYDNTISTNETQVLVGSFKFMTVSLTDLNPDKIYFYRLKALQGSDVIYSKEGILNTSKQVFLLATDAIENENSVKLTGYINSASAFLYNIEFEYGTTENLGSSIKSTPDYMYGNGTLFYSTILDNPLRGETYYYRLKALDINSNPLYSNILSFSTKSLGIDIPDLKKAVVLFPNPTNGILNINLPDNKNVDSILVNDESGKMFNYTNSVKTGNLQKIDLSGKSTGIYFIRIIMEDKSVIDKKVILK